MKKTLLKDTFREIKNSLGRFLAIFVIVALGVSFFAGIKATAPDMKITADKHFDEYRLMDFHLLSTMGFDDKDIEAIGKAEKIEGLAPSYSIDALIELEEETKVVKTISIPTDVIGTDDSSYINRVKLVEGKYPENSKEILIENSKIDNGNLSIGKEIELSSGRDEDILESLKEKEYTIVGLVESPEYISFERGSTDIGNGKIDIFAMIPEENFDMPVYTDVYLTVKEARKVLTYDDEYDEILDPIKVDLEDIGKSRKELRYEDILDEANKELAKGKNELKEGEKEQKKELKKAEEELSDAKIQIDDGEKELKDQEREFEKAISDAEETIAQEEQKLKDGENEYNKNLKSFNSTKKEANTEIKKAESQIASAEKELEKQEKVLKASAAELKENEALLEEKEVELEKGESALKQGEAELKEKEALLEDNEQKLENAEAQLAEEEVELENAEAQLAEKETELANKEVFLDEKEAELKELEASIEDIEDEEKKAEVIAIVEAGKAELKAGRKELEIGREELKAGKAELKAGREELEAGKTELKARRKELEAGKAELKAAKEELKTRKKELESGRAELEAGKSEIQSGKEELKEGRDQLEAGKNEIAASKEELESQKQKLISGEEELKKAKYTIDNGKAELEKEKNKLEDSKVEAREEFESARGDIKSAKEEYYEGYSDYLEGKEESDKELEEARVEIRDAEKEIEDIEKPEWYVLKRSETRDYLDFEMAADRIDAIAKIFPVFFFLISILVSLTTMTRMVDEERGHIGGLKAMGYSNMAIASKYLIYAGIASVGGSILGLILGFKIFPTVIFNAYRIMYIMPPITTEFNLYYAVISTAIAVITTTMAALAASYSELRETPALLLRPKAPKPGKRILLERIDFIWSRLKFTQKVTARNLFRYKRRFFMTIIGISGCTALLVAGFGLRDSITSIPIKQYDEIYQYEMILDLKDGVVKDNRSQVFNLLRKNDDVEDYMMMKEQTIDIGTSSLEENVNLIVPEDSDELEDFIVMQNRKTGEDLSLREDGVILTEKISKLLDVGAGDEIYIVDEDDKKHNVEVIGVTENYLNHYVYMPRNIYEKIFQEEVEFQRVLAKTSKTDKVFEDEISEKILKCNNISSIEFITGISGGFNDAIGSLNYVIMVLILSAAALAFVVLYNLTNINISERIREIATIKVLGFYDREVSAYVYKENTILTLIGTAGGLFLGIFLHKFIIDTTEIEFMMFGQNVKTISFVYSALLTIIFAASVNFVMHFKLKKVDMVESLKSID